MAMLWAGLFLATPVLSQEVSEETALLSPALIDGGPVDKVRPLPRVLTTVDAKRYRAIFDHQRRGEWKQADALIRTLDDPLLLGHVKQQRYMHPTAYRSSWKELSGWLDRYADHPGAKRIYRLALRRKAGDARAPRAPIKGYLGGNGADAVVDVKLYVSPRKRSNADLKTLRQVKREIRRRIRRGWPSGALALLDGKLARDTLDKVEFAEARAAVAHGYFIFGKDSEALRLAAKSAAEAGDRVPIAYWTAGLAAWRTGDIVTAGKHFGALALSDQASRATRAAGAYWASRAALKQRRPADATRWLARAAHYPLTFYGLLGRRALGVEVPFDWSLPRLSDARLSALMSHPGGRRALALMQVGESDRAEREWRTLFPRLEPALREPLMTLATQHNMPGLAIRLAGIVRLASGRTYHAALYPVPSWTPEGGFNVDRALIYGIIRQESGFDTRAKSGRGARGLMQLMPRTATSVDDDDELDHRHELYQPELNMALGQRYVSQLLESDRVDGDLFRLLVGYNAGPGNLAKWKRKVTFHDDPLLFIESIPSRETRQFIERVLANVWIYRQRLGQPAPSLDRVAAGDWARYDSVDRKTGFVVRHARY